MRRCLVVLALAAGCHAAPAPLVCTPTTPELTPIDPATFALVVDDDPVLAPVRDDVKKDLAQLWSHDVAVEADASSAKDVLWISTSAEARALSGEPPANGYRLARAAHGSGTAWLVTANDAEAAAAGAYALLEELGYRFFHPRETYVPPPNAPGLPKTLDVSRKPAFALRGLQFHTLHPIEYFDTLNEPGAQSLAEAQQLIDWLVETGQNYFQWVPVETVDQDAWHDHARKIIAMAHARGVKVGVSVQLWQGASLQNGVAMVKDSAHWQDDLDQNLATLMQVPWDDVELTLGEFLAGDPQSIIDWLDHATATMQAIAPGVELSVVNHVGNYPELWVKYQGETVFYYHLPQFCDARLANTVHTVYFFDLYRDRAMYGHPDFHLQHDYLMSQLGKRHVRYMPESAYWISSDVDVPLFLPEYLFSRWNDIHGINADIEKAGLPPLEGHVQFSSGHEWAYWMTDYLAAEASWQPEASLDTLVDHVTAIHGSCGGDVTSEIDKQIALQSKYLFEGELSGYLIGEDQDVELGRAIGIQVRPPRIEFVDLLRGTEDARKSFEKTQLAGLDAFAAGTMASAESLAKICAADDARAKPWCDELEDGTEITALRAQHTAHVYRAILAAARGGSPDVELAAAQAIETKAAAIVARREKHYRFPLDRVAGAYENPTTYPFGYLHQTHTLCFWSRRRIEARATIDTGTAPTPLDLPSCLN